MTNFKNYGDVSLEHGFILVAQDSVTETAYRIIKTEYDCDGEQFLLYDLYVDISDDWISWNSVSSCCDTDLSNPIQKAIDVTYYYNYQEFQCYAPLKFDTLETLEDALKNDFDVDFTTI
jgi:hypothetical protein